MEKSSEVQALEAQMGKGSREFRAWEKEARQKR